MKNHAKIASILFLIGIVFPGILFVALPKTETIDEQENRPLANFPDSNTKLEDFPEDYQAYFNDHVPFRRQLKNLWSKAHYVLFHESYDDRVIIGKQEDEKHVWLFYQADWDGDPLKEAQGAISYSEKEKEEMYETIMKNNEVVEEYGFQLYYMSGPNKESVYQEYLPDLYQTYNDSSRLEQYIQWLKEEKGYDNYLYPLEDLRVASKSHRTYYRQDIHWNDYGGYIGFLNFIHHAHPEVEDSFLEDIQISESEPSYLETDLIKLSGIHRIFLDEKVFVQYHPELEVGYNKMFQDTVIETRCEEAPIDKTIFIIGDSFRDAMIPYFERTYKHCFFMHRHHYYTIYLDWFWPDEVLLLSVERYAIDNMQLELKQEEETYPIEG